MVELVWLTDPHFNFLGIPINPSHHKEGVRRWGTPCEFGRQLAKNHPDAAGCVISGDIAEAKSVMGCLDGFSTGWGKPVYYVLGNHDYYGGSWKGVHRQLTDWKLKWKPIIWLRQAGVIELAPDLAICGNEGWYDGRAGHDPIKPRIMMTDFSHIKEMRGLSDFNRKMLIAETAAHWAAEAAIHLREACAKYKNVLFVTHVPPFPETTWHEGQVSNNDWLPWMCNVTLGDTLIEIAYEFPETSILVLCGHTHSPGDVRMAPNLRVLTGKSDYWYPQVAGVLRLPEGMPLLR